MLKSQLSIWNMAMMITLTAISTEGCTWVAFGSSSTSSGIIFQSNVTTLAQCQSECLAITSCKYGLDWNPNTNSSGHQCAFTTADGKVMYSGSVGTTHYDCVNEGIIFNGCSSSIFTSCFSFTTVDDQTDIPTWVNNTCSNLANIIQCFNSSGCIIDTFDPSGSISHSTWLNYFFNIDALRYGCTGAEEFSKFKTCIGDNYYYFNITRCSNRLAEPNTNAYNYERSPSNETFCKNWNSDILCYLSLPNVCGANDFIYNFTALYFGQNYVRDNFGCLLNTTKASEVSRSACRPEDAADCFFLQLQPTPGLENDWVHSSCKMFSDSQECLTNTGCTVDDYVKFPQLVATYLYTYACNNTTDFASLAKCFDPTYYSDAHKCAAQLPSFGNTNTTCWSEEYIACQVTTAWNNGCGSRNFAENFVKIKYNDYHLVYGCTYYLFPNTTAAPTTVATPLPTISIIAEIYMKDKKFKSSYQNLSSPESVELTKGVCDSLTTILSNISSGILKTCKTVEYREGSVIDKSQMNFASNGSSAALLSEVFNTIGKDFNSSNGIFRSNLNTNATLLNIQLSNSPGPAPNGSSKGPPIGAIIGGVVGGLAGVAIIVAAVLVVKKIVSDKAKQTPTNADNDDVRASKINKVKSTAPEENNFHESYQGDFNCGSPFSKVAVNYRPFVGFDAADNTRPAWYGQTAGMRSGYFDYVRNSPFDIQKLHLN